MVMKFRGGYFRNWCNDPIFSLLSSLQDLVCFVVFLPVHEYLDGDGVRRLISEQIRACDILHLCSARRKVVDIFGIQERHFSGAVRCWSCWLPRVLAISHVFRHYAS